MFDAIRAWMTNLESYPGWKEWRRQRIGHTLYFDDLLPSLSKPDRDFQFSKTVEREHDVVIQYLGLQQMISSLKECEFYFRRYPFRELPVTRYNHITNVCEMYFGRFYEFKERLKHFFKAVNVAAPEYRIDIGVFIRDFEKVFGRELRERNHVHHHGRFEDIAIDRILLAESFATGPEEKGWKREHLTAYRKLAEEWARRVQRRGKEMDEFLEAVAGACFANCTFLRELPVSA